MTEMHDLNRDAQHVSPVATRKFNSPALGGLGFHPLVEIVDDCGAGDDAGLNHEGCNAA